VDRGTNGVLVEHQVHVPVIPLGGQDLAADPERWPPVMVLLDRFGQAQCEPSSLV
jgi:hypothetical protein